MQPFKVKAYIVTIHQARQVQVNLNGGWTTGLIEPVSFIVQATGLDEDRSPEEINSQLYSLMREGPVEVTITPVKKQMSNLPKWDNPAY